VIDEDVFLRFCDEKLDAMTDIVIGLGDTAANTRPDLQGANSPYAILTHCLGVMAWWGREVNRGQSVGRDRAAEFEATGAVRELVAHVAVVRVRFHRDVRAADPEAPPINLPGERDDFWSGTQGGVLMHVYEELAQHLGQMELTRDLLMARLSTSP
jgi:Protein of unknown function (DUF664)